MSEGKYDILGAMGIGGIIIVAGVVIFVAILAALVVYDVVRYEGVRARLRDAFAQPTEFPFVATYNAAIAEINATATSDIATLRALVDAQSFLATSDAAARKWMATATARANP